LTQAERIANFALLSRGDETDHGRRLVDDGDLERVGLARGGFYRLTKYGEDRARVLARQAIYQA
jgi:hypothetical protein